MVLGRPACYWAPCKPGGRPPDEDRRSRRWRIARVAQATAALGELERQPATRTLLLEGLGESDVSRLIEVVAEASPSPQMAAAVHSRTGGNPLFVGELVRLLVSEGRLVEPIHEADVRRSIPRGVRDVIAKRLTLVPDASREMLGMGSVLGREFSIHTVAHARGRTASEILDLLTRRSPRALSRSCRAAPTACGLRTS